MDAIILVQYALAGPGGAQVDLQRGMRHANRLLAANKIKPFFDDHIHEVRLLPIRPDDYQHVQDLFRAAKDARIVVPVGSSSDRFNLLKTEPHLRPLFAPDRFEADWKTTEFFMQQLKTGRFVDYVQAIHPNLVDWLSVVQQLRAEFDPRRVCIALAQHGIVEGNPHGLYRMTKVPLSQHMQIPYGLYSRRPGPVLGLSADEFVAELLRNDWLYNTVFWQLADALDQDRICAGDVPTFVIEYLQALE